jgi:RsiW-degrading membrane proteinase PrsW (M82 family)
MTVDEVRGSGATRRRSGWRYLASGGVLIGGVVAYLVVLFVMVDTQNVNFFPSLLLVGAITVPMSVLIVADQAGPASRVPTWAVVFTAIVGGVIGVVAAGLLEYDTLRTLGSLPMVLIGVIEEAAKLLVPVVLYLLWRPHDPRGGVLIGIASGMGFATLETMGYGFQALLSGGVAAVDQTLLLRALFSPACHVAWTGMTVAMLWRIRTAAHRVRAFLGFLFTYAAAVVLHAVWDGSTRVATHVAVAVVGLIVLGAFVLASRRELHTEDSRDAGLLPRETPT